MATRQTEEIYFEDVAGVAIAVAVHYARTDAGGEPFVVMAHGFHGDKTGGARHFVDLARDLARRGISTLRFDQPGNGDSAGNFEDASFDRWVATIEHFAERLSSAGHKVALLGESMGGVATMAAAADLGKRICGTALWSAGPLLGARTEPPKDGWMEEGGQQVSWNYWREAEALDFMEAYSRLEVPAYFVFGTADYYTPEEAMRSVEANCKPGDRVRIIEGLPHTSWPVSQWHVIRDETIDAFLKAFG